MYPRFGASVLENTFSCEILEVLAVDRLLVRTELMKNAYTTLYKELYRFYIESEKGIRLDQASLTPGTSCVVRHTTYAERAEIVHVDDDGYAEVNAVDEGRTIYVWASKLFIAEPLFALLPALNIEIDVYGLGGLKEIYYAEEILAMACTQHGALIGVVTDYNGSRAVVQLLNTERQDIGALVVDRINEDMADDEWLDDEGFADGEEQA